MTVFDSDSCFVAKMPVSIEPKTLLIKLLIYIFYIETKKNKYPYLLFKAELTVKLAFVHAKI